MVDDVPNYNRSNHEATISEAVELLTVDIGSFAFLASPVRRSGSGAIEDTVKVDSNDIALITKISLDDIAFLGKNASIGDENI